METGWNDLLRRVRWGNVAPFAVILVAGAVLLLAPRAAHEPVGAPSLPVQPDPVALEPKDRPVAHPEAEEEPVAARPDARSIARTKPSGRARKRRRPKRRRPKRPPRPVAPAVPSPVPAPTPVWRPPHRPTPEQLEFAPLG